MVRVNGLAWHICRFGVLELFTLRASRLFDGVVAAVCDAGSSVAIAVVITGNLFLVVVVSHRVCSTTRRKTKGGFQDRVGK